MDDTSKEGRDSSIVSSNTKKQIHRVEEISHVAQLWMTPVKKLLDLLKK